MVHKRCNGWVLCYGGIRNWTTFTEWMREIEFRSLFLFDSIGYSHKTKSGSTAVLGRHINICLACCYTCQYNRPMLHYRLAHRSSPTSASATSVTSNTFHIASAWNSWRGPPKKISVLVSSTNSTWWYYFTGIIRAHQISFIIYFGNLITIFYHFQNYVSALQKRVQPGRNSPSEQSTKSSSHERNTLNSDRTHFTNIPDSDADKMDYVQERG